MRALNLLDLCLIGAQGNEAFVKYTAKKMMDRLRILGAYCPKDLDVSESSNLHQRGAFIFIPNEPDTVSACEFLVKLLNCVRSWSEEYPSDGPADVPSMFANIYEELGR